MSTEVARRMWALFEPLHDVVYFSPESPAAAKDLGLKGFWMGYFAFRAAPPAPCPRRR
ncbi:helix-turn-helix domain-containing protein [Jatrophihabitans fulvus]